MRKRLLMIFMLILSIHQMLLAADKIVIYGIKISAGETKEIEVSMENEDSYVAFQFDLYLPTGITLESYIVNRDRVPESTTVSMSQLNDGGYRFIAAAMQSEPISGTVGCIVKLTVKAADNLSEDELTGYLRNIKLAKEDATGISITEKSFKINDDGFVDSYFRLTIDNDEFIITPGETKDVSIWLHNSSQYVAFQFDLYLPEGISILSAEADRSRVPENTSLSMSQQEDGSYRFITAAISGEPLVGKKGNIVTLKVKASDDLIPGRLDGYFRNIKMAKADATGEKESQMSFSVYVNNRPCVVTATSYTRAYGDANPVFEYTTEGASLDGTPTITCNATETSAVGTYAITISKGSVTNSNVTFVDGKLTITTKTVDKPTILLSETNYTFDGNAKEPTITVNDGDKTIPAAEYSVSYTNNTNVGTATVTITDVEGGNYAVSGSTTFTISKAEGSVTAPVGKSDLVYNGAAQDLITAGSTTTGTLEYSLDGITYAGTIPQGTDAGSYTVYYMVTGDANHNDIAAQNFQVTIASKTVESPTITLSQTSYTYDGNAKEPTVTVKDGETTIPAAEYSVGYTNNTNVGTATVTITDKDGGNYAVSGSTTFTISAADGSLTAPTGNSNLVYNGVAQDLITAGSTTTGTIEYSLDGTTYETTIPQGTDAGSYTVYYKVAGDANHNDIAAQHFDVKIAKAALTVSAGDYEIYEGDEIPSFEVKYEGFVNNETADDLTTKPTISCEATKGSSPDEYKVTVSGAEAKNYEITHVDGKLTILAKSFVSGGDENKDEDDSATYQVNDQGGDGDTPPTVAITDDKDVSGSFAIPESVTYQNKTYTVTEIGEGAFENNKNLTNVSIPSSITNIGDKAFKGCSNLKSITVNITTPISLSAPVATRRMTTRTDGSSVFDGVDMATCILYVPEGSVELYKAAPVWCEFQNIMPLSSTGIKDILMPDGEAHDIYNLQGRKVKAKATSLEGLSPGVYIINGKKTILK